METVNFDDQNLELKIQLVGKEQSGKTQIINKIKNESFNNQYIQTHVQSLIKQSFKIQIGQKEYQLLVNLRDQSGEQLSKLMGNNQYQFRDSISELASVKFDNIITSMDICSGHSILRKSKSSTNYFQPNLNAIIYIFDLNSPTSLDFIIDLKKHYDQNHQHSQAIHLAVANKTDLINSNQNHYNIENLQNKLQEVGFSKYYKTQKPFLITLSAKQDDCLSIIKELMMQLYFQYMLSNLGIDQKEQLADDSQQYQIENIQQELRSCVIHVNSIQTNAYQQQSLQFSRNHYLQRRRSQTIDQQQSCCAIY